MKSEGYGVAEFNIQYPCGSELRPKPIESIMDDLVFVEFFRRKFIGVDVFYIIANTAVFDGSPVE